jgi:hypothetical protein
MLQITMSVLVALAGVFVVATADGGIRLFGWVLVLVGVLGIISGYMMRSRRRG